MTESPENKEWRKTGQYILPLEKKIHGETKYNIYPSYKIHDNQVFAGFGSLSEIMKNHRVVIIDGYEGIFYEQLSTSIAEILHQQGFTTSWINTRNFLKPADKIREITAPFLGGDDPLFGKRTTLNIGDFFEIDSLRSVCCDPASDINIIFGPGAALAGWNGLLIYADLPKNELQFRSRAHSITNLGAATPEDAEAMYKCFYFVDWVVLDKHKRDILPSIDIYVDAQRPDVPVWIRAEVLKDTLSVMSRNVFRVRPWFEPGAWGGSWIKDNIDELNKNESNYAWSFELIAPENGLLIESSSLLIEVSFNCLMDLEAKSVLGDCFPRFGINFPLRFDFLDTFDGGNLSLQCHPRPDYMKKYFGEDFTQEETYYILDTKNDAFIFLGFCDNIDPEIFNNALEESYMFNKPLDPDKFVLKHQVKKHDLLLIPYGTIHGSGKNNLVLEISSTPYIFTFRMYDWLRMDLDGKPRSLNIKRGMDNLFFNRKGRYIKEKLIPQPELIDSGKGWALYHLPTHETHLYDIHRYHFTNEIEIKTNNKCLVMNLVEGTSITVKTANGLKQNFSYAETFIIPAAASVINIFNNSDAEAILIKAFVK